MKEYTKTALFIALIILLTFAVLKAASVMMKKHEQKKGFRIHQRFFYNAARLFVILLALSAIGSRFSGVSSTVNTILASSGILALGISLAAKESLTNIIDGLFISIFKPFDIGDRITLPEKNGLTGIVKEINLRHTVILTYTNSSYIVPNSIMSSSIVDNSNFQNEDFAYPIDVSISYDDDIEKAIALLARAITEHPDFHDLRTDEQKQNGEPAVVPLVREFGDSGIALRGMVHVDNVPKSFKACSDVRIAVKKLFDENGITIPFNTVHIDNPSSGSDV